MRAPMTDFCMPILGADMTSGTVVEYLAEPGEVVSKGQVIAVIDTEKAAIEVESPVDGIWDSVVVPVGQEVPVGTVLATIAASPAGVTAPPAADVARKETVVRERPQEPTPRPVPDKHHERRAAPEPPVASPLVRHLAHSKGIDLRHVTPTGPRGVVTREDIQQVSAPRLRSSPYARRLAASLQIDPRAITGTGPGGAVRAADVTGFAATHQVANRPAVRPPETPTPQSKSDGDGAAAAARRQAAVASLMSRSKREIPHFYLGTTADCGPLLEEVRRRNAGRPVSERLLPAAGLLRAVVQAALEVPMLNGRWIDGAAELDDDVHLGIAISLRDGSLIAPAMRSCQNDPIEQLMGRLKGLVARARQGRLSGDDATDPSITITNLGDLGVEVVYPIIYPPQLAMVGLGRISNRPWAIGDSLAVRPVVTVTLAVDHRAVNGHQAGLFLGAVTRALQAPAEL